MAKKEALDLGMVKVENLAERLTTIKRPSKSHSDIVNYLIRDAERHAIRELKGKYISEYKDLHNYYGSSISQAEGIFIFDHKEEFEDIHAKHIHRLIETNIRANIAAISMVKQIVMDKEEYEKYIRIDKENNGQD